MADERELHPDPIVQEPGAHPVGTGGGSAGGAVAERINPTTEEAYWRETYTHEPYYRADRSFDDYHPAYELGWTGYGIYGGSFETSQDRMAGNWEARRRDSSLTWAEALPAVRAAWNRAHGLQSQGPMERDDVVDVLNDLVETCLDGEHGFKACADHAEGAMLKALFLRRAAECHYALGELETHVRRLGGEPIKRGTASGALHRGWVALRGTLGGYSDQAMLEECERGEDAALARYRKALKNALPSNVRQLVEYQCQGVQRNHDQIKALRDQGRAHHSETAKS